VTMPFGTDITALIATFTTTGQNVTVNGTPQVSGATPNNFTNPVAYLVTAADGSTATYTVTVTIAPNSAKAITAFSLAGTPGTIIGQNIAVTMPFGTDVTALIATFTTTGQSVTVNGTPQVSGTTPNNFTNPVAYLVTAADGSTATYTVTVMMTPSSPFIAYYPVGCTISNAGAGIIGDCICVQDATTHDVWTVKTSGNNQCYNSLMDANGTCPNYTTPDVRGYIPTLNSNNTCGFTDNGWNLPSQTQLATMSNYVSAEPYGAKGTWFNNNGFMGINNSAIYLGWCYGTTIACTLPSGNIGDAWIMHMEYGIVNRIPQNDSEPNTYGWGVHSGHKASIKKFSLDGTAGTITGQKIVVTMPFGTDVTALIATFTTTGQSVRVDGKPQVSGTTPNNFTNPLAYVVTAADGSMVRHTVIVTVLPQSPFIAYYPVGCTISNAGAGITGDCICVQDATTHDVWTVTTSGNNQCYNSLMDANGTCPNYTTPDVRGYIPTLNSNNTCGFTDNGWNLPSQTQLATMSNYVSAEPYGAKGTWFNNNGFSGIDNHGIYWGHCNGTNCTLPSSTNGDAWIMYMQNGFTDESIYQNVSLNVTYGWGVHSGQ
jgi:large repetitive protein